MSRQLPYHAIGRKSFSILFSRRKFTPFGAKAYPLGDVFESTGSDAIVELAFPMAGIAGYA